MSLVNYPNKIENAIKWYKDPYAFLNRAQSKHGLTFTAALPGTGKLLITGEPRLIEEISSHKQIIGGKGVTLMRTLFGGESLMMLQGETHQTHRRLLTPPFHRRHIAQYDDLTVETTLDVLRTIPDNRSFSAFDIFRRITQIVIVRIVFGKLPQAEETQAVELIHSFMTSFQNPITLFLKPLQINLGQYSPWGRITQNRQGLRDFIRERIKSFSETSENPQSLLAHLSRQNAMLEEDTITEIFATLMFGHDTTAVAAAWAMAHIYSHPNVLAHLQDDNEQDLVSGKSFIEACINESMRLSPTVVQLLRTANIDLTISGFNIKSGETIMPCPYLAHRNPKVFHQPEKYLPERFLEREYPTFSFFPFGLGNRLCVGKHLAQRQMPLMISTIIKNTSLRLAPGYTPDPVRYMFFIAPRKGTLMVNTK